MNFLFYFIIYIINLFVVSYFTLNRYQIVMLSTAMFHSGFKVLLTYAKYDDLLTSSIVLISAAN